MRVLVACEESQRVCIEFRKRGHEAYSCDIEPCSGRHDEWHIQQDVLPLLNGNCEFKTMNGTHHKIDGKWDMILAFPPCTHLAVSGAKYFEKKRADGRQREAIDFFNRIMKADCEHIAIENPINIIGGKYIKKYFPEFSQMPNCTQKIQPYEYGHKTKKTTCLWLKGIPNLKPTEIVEPELATYKKKNGSIATFGNGFDMCRDENGKIIAWNDPRTAKIRSKTFPGIAKAMAEQWG